MMSKGPLERRERLHRACKNIIDGGPRNVDAGTVSAFKSAALKYVATQYADTTQGLEVLYRDGGELGSSLRKAVEIIDAADLDDDGDRDDDTFLKIFTGKAGGADIAKARDRGAGPHGLTGALLEHLHDRLERRREQHGYQKSAKESPMSSLQDIAKTHGVPGVVEIAKNIVDAEKSYRITEEEFVNLIDTAARVAHPALGARALEKVYEHNPVLAKAIAVIKAWPSPMSLTPTMVGGTDAMLQVSDANPDALQQLTEMAESQRRAGESAAQAFERVYLDPANRHLAEAERGQNRPQPTTIFPLPR